MSPEPSITMCMIIVLITNGSSKHMDRGYTEAPSPPPENLD